MAQDPLVTLKAIVKAQIKQAPTISAYELLELQQVKNVLVGVTEWELTKIVFQLLTELLDTQELVLHPGSRFS